MENISNDNTQNKDTSSSSVNLISSSNLKPISEAIHESAMRGINSISNYEILLSILLQINSSQDLDGNFSTVNDKEYFLGAFSAEVIGSILEQYYILGEDGDEICLHILGEYCRLFLKFFKAQGINKLIGALKEIFEFKKHFYRGNVYDVRKISHDIINKKLLSFEEFDSSLVDRSVFIQSLSVGKEIDVNIDISLKSNNAFAQVIKTWMRGVIKSLSMTDIVVIIPGVKETATISLASLDYSECGRFTKDYDWRFNLKPGDVIMCFDRNQYYPATIIERKEDEKSKQNKIVFYRIGFRLYIDLYPNWKNHSSYWGSQIYQDEKGQKYIGDAENFDEVIPYFSKYIQNIDDYPNNINNEAYFYDNLIPFNPQSQMPNYVIGRNKSFSYFYSVIINKFCMLHGYEDILDYLLKEPNSENSNDMMILFIEIIGKTATYLHLDYIRLLSNKIKELFELFLTNEKVLKAFKKEYIDSMFQILIFFISRVSSSEYTNTTIRKITLVSSFQLLKTDVLEKRLIALKKITDLVQVTKGDSRNQLLEEIEKNNVISLLFGSNSHNQLIVKSKELIEVIAKEGNLTNSQLNGIWLGTKNGDLESKLSIINIIKEISGYISKEKRDYLIKLLLTKDYKSLSLEEIELIQLNDSNGQQSFEYFINLLYSISANNDSRINKIVTCLIECLLLNNDNQTIFNKLYNHCCDSLKNSSNVHITLILLSKMIKANLFKTKKEYHQMVELFILSFNSFKESTKECINKEDISQRLSFAMLLYQNNPDSFENMIQLMFEFLVITNIAPDLFYTWAYNILTSSQSQWQSQSNSNYQSESGGDNYNQSEKNINAIKGIKQSLLSLFKTLIIPNKNLLSDFPLIGLELFMELFVQLNEKTIHTAKQGKSFYEVTLSSIPLEELKGFDIFWEIILVNKNQTIVNMVFQFLFLSYRNMKELNSLLQRSISLFSNDQMNDFSKLFKILSLMIEESERKGLPECIMPHIAIRKLGLINISVMTTLIQEGCFMLSVYLTTTIWELKKIIAKRIQITEDFIELSFENIEKGNHIDNGRTLKELELIEYHNVRVTLNNILDTIPRAQLIGNNNQIVDEFKAVLNKWYDDFSNSEGKMDKVCCARFIKGLTNTRDDISSDDSRVENFFKTYDKTKQGYIPKESIIRFFTDAAMSEKRILVWENLNNLGVRNDLKPFSEAYNMISNDSTHYPRWVLAQNQQFFNRLINYDTDDLVVQNQIITFMNKLSTNNVILSQVANFNYEQFNAWLKETKSPFIKLNYVLPIIENYLEEFDYNLLHNDNIIIKKHQSEKANSLWLSSFLDKRGYHLLMNIFNMKTNSTQVIDTEVIDSLLRIIRIIYDLYFRQLSNSNEDKLPNDDLTQKIELMIKEHNLIDYLIPLLKIDININAIELLLNTISFASGDQYKEMLNKINESNILNVILTCLNQKKDFETIIIKFIKINTQLNRFELISNLLNQMYIELTTTDSPAKDYSINFYNVFGVLYSHYITNKEKFISNSDSNSNKYEDYLDTLVNSIHLYLSQSDTKEEVKMTNDQFKGYLSIFRKAMTLSSQLKKNLTLLISDIMNTLLLSDSVDKISFIKDYYIDLDEFIKEQNTFGISNSSIRMTCYTFIKDLVQNDPESLFNLLSHNAFFNLSNSPSTSQNKNSNNKANQSKSKSTELSNKLKVENHVGIRNPRCICYMNSILQQFYMIPTLRNAIMQTDDKQKENIVKLNSVNTLDDNTYHQIQKMFSYLNFSLRSDYNPIDFCYSFKDYDGNPTDINAQQDSNEFLSLFIEKMENALRSTPHKYLTESVFKGSQCTQLKCSICNTARNRYEDFNYLSLEVKNMKNISDSLNKLIDEETIDGYDCETCSKKVQIKKRNLLSTLPNVLMVYLQRMYYDYETDHNEKINSWLEFPKILNMKPYTVESTQKEENDEIYSKPNEYYEYYLVGVNVHFGISEAGHYFSFINTSRDGKENEMILNSDTWLQFNDSQISKFDISKLAENCFGGKMKKEESQFFPVRDSIQSAYMLVYERRIKSPLKVLIGIDIINTESSQDTSKPGVITIEETNVFSVNRQYSIFSHLNDSEFNNKLYNDIVFYDKSKNEYFKYVPFYTLNRKIAKKYFIEIFRDNIQFQKHQNITDNNFQIFIAEILFVFCSTILSKDNSYDLNMNTKVVNAFMGFLFNFLSTKNKNKILSLLKPKLTEAIKSTKIGVIEIFSQSWINKVSKGIMCLTNDNNEISKFHCHLLYLISLQMLKEHKGSFIKSELMTKVLIPICQMIPNVLKEDKKTQAANILMTIGRLIKCDNYILMQPFVEIDFVSHMFALLFSYSNDEQNDNNNGYCDWINTYSINLTEELIEILYLILSHTIEYNELNHHIKMNNKPKEDPLICLNPIDWQILKNEQLIHLIYKSTPQYFAELSALFSYVDAKSSLIICKEIVSYLYDICYLSQYTNLNEILNAIFYILRIDNVEKEIKQIQMEILIGFNQVRIEENTKMFGFPNIGWHLFTNSSTKGYSTVSLINKKNTCALLNSFNYFGNKVMLLDLIYNILHECKTNAILYEYVMRIHIEECSFTNILSYAKYVIQLAKGGTSQKGTQSMIELSQIEELVNELYIKEQKKGGFGDGYYIKDIHKEKWTFIEQKNDIILIEIKYYVSVNTYKECINVNSIKEIIEKEVKEEEVESDHQNQIDPATGGREKSHQIDDQKGEEEDDPMIYKYYNKDKRPSSDKKTIQFIADDLSNNKIVVFKSNDFKGKGTLCLIRYLAYNSSQKDSIIYLVVNGVNRKDIVNEYIPHGEVQNKLSGYTSKTLLTVSKINPSVNFSFESLAVLGLRSVQLALQYKGTFQFFQINYNEDNKYGAESYKNVSRGGGNNNMNDEDEEFM